MSFKSNKMTDPLIEGITYEEPKPGLVEKVKDYVYPQITDTDEEVDIEEKRESLAILASTGTTKDYLGVQMSLGDVNKADHKRCEKVLLSIPKQASQTSYWWFSRKRYQTSKQGDIPGHSDR